jgi:hypothetical protein
MPRSDTVGAVTSTNPASGPRLPVRHGASAGFNGPLYSGKEG